MSDIRKTRMESENVQSLANLQGDVDANQNERARAKVAAEERSPQFQKILKSEENLSEGAMPEGEKPQGRPKGPLDLLAGNRGQAAKRAAQNSTQDTRNVDESDDSDGSAPED